ncbi:unnamed protein product [Pelagomonas calceolata]|uniref:Uncharacterized protein n=1 Tax=Pelagomonas calceolata TaxID=35677 RepID=A0A8J2SM83_9STRA|nr:unnamed protein product [Pelagomonas calceolata]
MPAAGTAAADELRCSRASTAASVGLLTSVSMATVRGAAPLKPDVFASARARAAARRGIATTPTCARHDDTPYAAAAPPATRSEVETMPAGAHKGFKRFATRGKSAAVRTPAPSGARTRLAVDARIAPPSTAMVDRRSRDARNGVATHPRSVVDVVSTTLSAASPPPSNAQRFDAWPPLTQPRRRSPARASDSSRSAVAQAIEARGATAKQHTAFMRSARGDLAARFRSFGVNVRPMDTMSRARPRRNAAFVPSVAATLWGAARPRAAAATVRTGKVRATRFVCASSGAGVVTARCLIRSGRVGGARSACVCAARSRRRRSIVLPETFLQPGQSRLVVRDGRCQCQTPALSVLCKARVCVITARQHNFQSFRRVRRCSQIQPFGCCAVE